MISVKQAVAAAITAVHEFYQITPDNQLLVSSMLEEVDRTDDGKHRLITISFYPPNDPNQGSGLLAKIRGDQARRFKVIKVNADTGGVESMRIRELAMEPQLHS